MSRLTGREVVLTVMGVAFGAVVTIATTLYFESRATAKSRENILIRLDDVTARSASGAVPLDQLLEDLERIPTPTLPANADLDAQIRTLEGSLLMRRATAISSGADLAKAADRFESALEFHEAAASDSSVITQIHLDLGQTYGMLSLHENRLKNLEKATAHFRSALEALARRDYSEEHRGSVQHKLGNLYFLMAPLADNELEVYERARDAYAEASRIFAEETDGYAKSRINLGNALTEIGRLTQSQEVFTLAEQAFESTDLLDSESGDYQRALLNRAYSQLVKGRVLGKKGDLEAVVEELEALAATSRRDSYELALTKAYMGLAHQALAKMESSPLGLRKRLRKAVSSLSEAAELIRIDQPAPRFGEFNEYAAEALVELAGVEDRRANLLKALVYYQAARAQFTHESFPREFARIDQASRRTKALVKESEGGGRASFVAW